MNKPDFSSLPRAFREDYAKFAAVRLGGSAVFLCAAGAACFIPDFSGLKYPAMGPVFIMAAAAAVCPTLRKRLCKFDEFRG